MKLTFKGVDISTEEKFVSYINSLNTAIMKQNAMNEIKQDLYDVSYLKKRIDTLWNDLPENSAASKELEKIFNQRGIFDNPKPTELIKRCLEISNSSAIVLDFFAGSGTTGQAVLELNKADDGNREFILCTNNEVTDSNPNGIAYDVTSKRLKRVMTGSCYDGTKDFVWLKDNTPLEDNLDVYEIADVSNFEATAGKTPFDVIDETLYGKEKCT